MTHRPVSLIVVTYGHQHLVQRLLDSLRDHPDRALLRDIVVVDNGFPSLGDSRSLVTALHGLPVRFVQNAEHSYTSGINLGAAACDGPLLAIANSDVEWLAGESLAPLVQYMAAHPDVGIAGPQQVFPDGSWQRSAGPFPSLGQALATLLFIEVARNGFAAWRHGRGRGAPGVRAVDYVDGAFMVIARACFDALGGMDPAYAFYAEDADFSWRAAQAGWGRVQVPTARVMHVRGASSKAVASVGYIRRLFAAQEQFVRRSAGAGTARVYGLMQRVGACEYAAVYSLIALVRRTPGWRRRSALARAAARAALTTG